MAIALTCSCGRALKVKDELAGRKIRCPACKGVLTVPAKEVDPDDLVLEVLAVEEPKEERASSRPARRSAIQSEPPEVLPAKPRPPKDEGVSTARRRSRDDDEDDERPIRRRPRPIRKSSSRAPRVAFESGWFGSTNSGVIGGLLMILIAVVWLVVGLSFGWLFYYPVILLVIGFISIIKGLVGAD